MDLDMMSPLELVTINNHEDAKVAECITPVLKDIAQCVTWTIESIERGGRIIYMGAGTSGRLGVLDAVEYPTISDAFLKTIVGLIAEGKRAAVKALVCMKRV